MALIDSVRVALERLGPHGWDELLDAHGIDLGAGALRRELLRSLPGIDRDLPGFDDFATVGEAGNRTGRPALSLLYHVLASPA
jgi:hypothetical protein